MTQPPDLQSPDLVTGGTATAQWLQVMTEQSPAIVCLCDLEGRYIFVSRRFEAVYGVPASSALARDPQVVLGAALGEAAVQYHQEVLATSRSSEHTSRFTSVSGEHIFNELRFPVRDDSGRIAAVGLIATDVTEQQFTEALLRKSDALKTSILDSAIDAVVAIDERGCVIEFNPGAEKIFGYRRHEVLGRPVSESIIPDRLRDAHQDGLSRFLRTGKFNVLHRRTELPAKHRDGHEIPIEIALAPAEVDGRKIFAATLRDITPRKVTEAALRASEERYKLAMRGANDGLWDWDVAADRLHISPRFCEVVGFDGVADEISPSEWLSKLHPDDYASYRSGLLAHFRGETDVAHVEFRIIEEEHEPRWLLARGAGLRDEEGRIYRMVGSVSDITERKNSELALEHAREQAESATQAKSRFMASMSHELRTPLNAIIGIGEMIREDLHGDQQDRLIEPMDRILGAGRHLLTLINDLLDLARIEAGHVALSAEEFSLIAVLEDVVATARPLAEANGNRLVLDATFDSCRLRADPTRVRQIVLNLLSNAAKFTQDGKLTVRVTVGDLRPSPTVLIDVSDTGIGISAEDQQQLFEEFTQVGDPASRVHGGAGLGLAISRSLCHLMGGDISVKSGLGEGTTFTVRLPYLEASLDSDISVE